MKKYKKIFCIGLSKTGTTSLHEAFRILGLNSVHHDIMGTNIKKIMEENIENGRKICHSLEMYDVFTDFSANIDKIKRIEKDCPKSLFIFTTRDIKSWVKSKINHNKIYNMKHPANPRKLNEENYKELFAKYHKQVYSYFKGRKDFLVMNICDGDGWEKLCEFLGMKIPNEPFPYANKRRGIDIFLKDKARKIKKMFRL